MGMYTELVFGARLRPDLPTDVVSILKLMTSGETGDYSGTPPNHPFFQTERWQRLFTGGSYYFGIHRPHCVMLWDTVSLSYSISSRSSIKSYDGEVDKFLDWIKPYVQQGSGLRDMFAMTCYEEDEKPTMHFLHPEEQ